MLSSLFTNSAIGPLEQFVNFAQNRHAILATNVANFDVPGYRVRDLSLEQFQARLKQAIAVRDRRPATASLGDPPSASGDPVGAVRDSLKSIVYHDDTNVGLEQQVAEITKNQLQHDMALSILTNQFRLLQAAISERA